MIETIPSSDLKTILHSKRANRFVLRSAQFKQMPKSSSIKMAKYQPIERGVIC